MTRETDADAIAQTTRALADAALRVAWLKHALRRRPLAPLAEALDVLCARAEQAEESAREVLLALGVALVDPDVADVVRALREEAAGAPLLALDRLLRQSLRTPSRPVADLEDERLPDYGKGRPLTLGERKSLARRTDRPTIELLLRDPHPWVIRQTLTNAKVTEDDVLRLAARRPVRPDVLAEIARSVRWSLRPRIRMALVQNPDTPPDVVAPLVGLLLRRELRQVASSPSVPALVRVLAHEHLQRRPPILGVDDDASSDPVQ